MLIETSIMDTGKPNGGNELACLSMGRKIHIGSHGDEAIVVQSGALISPMLGRNGLHDWIFRAGGLARMLVDVEC